MSERVIFGPMPNHGLLGRVADIREARSGGNIKLTAAHFRDLVSARDMGLIDGATALRLACAGQEDPFELEKISRNAS